MNFDYHFGVFKLSFDETNEITRSSNVKGGQTIQCPTEKQNKKARNG
jgi:hypothetical protein